MTTKDKILDLLDKTDRQGIDEVMDWLKGSGFFTAPASTHFHGNYEGGLAEHSLNVYTAAMRLRSTALSLTPSLEEQLPEDSVAIATLLHDICKADKGVLYPCWNSQTEYFLCKSFDYNSIVADCCSNGC